MKRFTAILLAGALALSLFACVGCGKKADDGSGNQIIQQTLPADQVQPSQIPGPPPASPGASGTTTAPPPPRPAGTR